MILGLWSTIEKSGPSSMAKPALVGVSSFVTSIPRPVRCLELPMAVYVVCEDVGYVSMEVTCVEE